MQSATADRMVLIRIGGGYGQATYGNGLDLRLQIEGAWVTLQIQHLNGEHAHEASYQTRFPVHTMRGQACIGHAFIETYEAPLLTGTFLPDVQGLDAVFTQLFQTFVRLHRRQLLRIAWSMSVIPGREAQNSLALQI